jgi:outer membrane lipoprotein-sorting protein
MRSATLALLLVSTAAQNSPATAPDPRAVLSSMEEAVGQIHDYTMLLVREERLRGKPGPRETLVIKWARPQSTYVRFVRPHKGREAIYVRGWNKDRVRAHKGSFPDINLNVNPTGNMAMARTHHPASSGSLVHFVGLVMNGVHKSQKRGEGSLRWVGEDRPWGRLCDQIELVSPSGGVQDKVRPGETLWDVAERHGADMYTILHHNLKRGWKKPTSPSAGDTVFVPHYYAGRVVLWIDRELHLPFKAEIYDHEGVLYEYYEHRDLKVNVGLTERDFDPRNPDYGF